jgi:hypothetical protein
LLTRTKLGAQYDGSQEHTLRQIAQERGIPLSTAANRYRSAFRLIVGRDYSPDLRARLIGFLKLSEWGEPVALPKLAGIRIVSTKRGALATSAGGGIAVPSQTIVMKRAQLDGSSLITIPDTTKVNCGGTSALPP